MKLPEHPKLPIQIPHHSSSWNALIADSFEHVKKIEEMGMGPTTFSEKGNSEAFSYLIHDLCNFELKDLLKEGQFFFDFQLELDEVVRIEDLFGDLLLLMEEINISVSKKNLEDLANHLSGEVGDILRLYDPRFKEIPKNARRTVIEAERIRKKIEYAEDRAKFEAFTDMARGVISPLKFAHSGFPAQSSGIWSLIFRDTTSLTSMAQSFNPILRTPEHLMHIIQGLHDYLVGIKLYDQDSFLLNFELTDIEMNKVNGIIMGLLMSEFPDEEELEAYSKISMIFTAAAHRPQTF